MSRPSKNRRRADRCRHRAPRAGELRHHETSYWSITLIGRNSDPGCAGTGHSRVRIIHANAGRLDRHRKEAVCQRAVRCTSSGHTRPKTASPTCAASQSDYAVSFVHGSRGRRYLRRRGWRNARCSPAPSKSRRAVRARRGRYSEPVAPTGPPTRLSDVFDLPSPSNSSAVRAKWHYRFTRLSRQYDGSWTVTMCNRRTGSAELNTKFVFVRAGSDTCRCCNPGSKGELRRLPDSGLLRAGNPHRSRYMASGAGRLVEAPYGSAVCQRRSRG